MAIKKIGTMSNPPGSNDWTTLMSLVQGFINKFNSRPSILSQDDLAEVLPYIKQGACISMGGTLYIVDTEDYTINGSVNTGLNYIKVASSGDTLTATWTQSLTGYEWNSIYNYYTDGTNMLLPYIIDYDGTDYIISSFDRDVNQKTRTDSSPTFAGLEVEHDLVVRNNAIVENDLYVRNETYLTDNLYPMVSPTSGTHEFDMQSTWTPPRGVYVMKSSSPHLTLSLDSGATTVKFQVGTIFADGNKVTLSNLSTSVLMTLTYLKF